MPLRTENQWYQIITQGLTLRDTQKVLAKGLFDDFTLASAGAGVSDFTDLDDTPVSITANQFVRGNAAGDALEHARLPVSQIADGTDGELITWGSDAAPATVAAGTSTQVLTSNGAGAAPTFQGGAITAFSFSDTNDVTINQAWPTGVLWSSSQSITIPTSGFILLFPYARCDNATGGTRDYHFGLQINSTDYFPQLDINGTPTQSASEHIGNVANGTYRLIQGVSSDPVFGLDIEGFGISTGSQTVQPIVSADASTATSTLKGVTVTSRLKVIIFDTS